MLNSGKGQQNFNKVLVYVKIRRTLVRYLSSVLEPIIEALLYAFGSSVVGSLDLKNEKAGLDSRKKTITGKFNIKGIRFSWTNSR